MVVLAVVKASNRNGQMFTPWHSKTPDRFFEVWKHS